MDVRDYSGLSREAGAFLHFLAHPVEQNLTIIETLSPISCIGDLLGWDNGRPIRAMPKHSCEITAAIMKMYNYAFHTIILLYHLLFYCYSITRSTNAE